MKQELGGFYYIELASEPNRKFHLQTRGANIIAIYAIPICVTQETLSSRAPSDFGWINTGREVYVDKMSTFVWWKNFYAPTGMIFFIMNLVFRFEITPFDIKLQYLNLIREIIIKIGCINYFQNQKIKANLLSKVMFSCVVKWVNHLRDDPR